MNLRFETEEFHSAVRFFEPNIKRFLMKMVDIEKSRAFEIRVRAEKPIIIVTPSGSKFLNNDGLLSEAITEKTVFASQAEVIESFSRFCRYSVHAYLNGIVKGYITLEGGHRAAVVGTAVLDRDGYISSLKDVSAINVRISREIKGSGEKIYKAVFKDEPASLIIAGPPASGKTTVLRDLVRLISSGNNLYKVALIDERQEIAAVNSGVAQKDVGLNTDILDSYPKKEAITIALKTLSPHVIALDEVAEEEEIRTITLGVNSGVNFIVTVHAENYEELLRRPLISSLMNTYSFKKVIMLKKSPVGEIENIYDVGELRDEIIRRSNNMDVFNSFGYESIVVS